MATETVRTDHLNTVIRELALTKGEMGVDSAYTHNPVTWERIWKAVQSDGAVQTYHFSGASSIIVVDASRRGPSVSHDVDTFSQTIEKTGITNILAPRIPHALLAHDFGYLTKGLPFAQQMDMLTQGRVSRAGSGLVIGTEGDMALLDAGRDPEAGRVWTVPSAEVAIVNAQGLMGRWLGIAGVRDSVITRVLEGMQLPVDRPTTLQDLMIAFSNTSMELVLAEAGYHVSVDTSPLPLPVAVDSIAASPVETTAKSALQKITAPEQAGWYDPFINSAKKLAESLGEDPAEALNRANKLFSRHTRATAFFAFSPETFVSETARGEIPVQAFLRALSRTADLGAIILADVKEAISRKPNGVATTLPYVTGPHVFGQLLEGTGHIPNSAIGVQPFEARQETALALRRLYAIARQRGQPIPAIEVNSRETSSYNISILHTLASM